MKTISSIFIFFFFLPYIGCKKDKPEKPRMVHCNGLVTDTAGKSDPAKVYIPNAFTPNADGINDVFFPFTSNVSSYTLTIFDDKNNVLFESGAKDAKWAPAQNAGTSSRIFYYKVQCITDDNNRIGACGEVRTLMNCVPKGIDTESLRFSDQINVDKGFIYPTQEPLKPCP